MEGALGREVLSEGAGAPVTCPPTCFSVTLSVNHIPPLILQVHLQYIIHTTRQYLDWQPQKLHCNNQVPTGVLPIKTSGLLFKMSFQLPLPYLHMKQAQYNDEEHTTKAI